MGPVGEIRLMPDPDTFTLLPYAPHAAAMTADMCTLDGRALGGVPALVPQAADRRLRRGRLHRAGRLRVRVHPGRPQRRRRLRAARRVPVLLHDRHDHGGAGDGRHRRRARGAGHPGRAVLSRARPRPAGTARSATRPRSPPPTARSSIARPSAPSPTATGCTPRSRPSPSPTRRAMAPHPLQPVGHGGPAQPDARPARALSA